MKNDSMTLQAAARVLVLDTNVVLDLLLFNDPGVASLRESLLDKRVRWIATPAMRQELLRVLSYPRVATHLAARDIAAAVVMEAFDQASSQVDAAPPCNVRCDDADDQMFIDLAVAHGATLVSKDRAVLAVHKRIALHGASVQQV